MMSSRGEEVVWNKDDLGGDKSFVGYVHLFCHNTGTDLREPFLWCTQ